MVTPGESAKINVKREIASSTTEAFFDLRRERV